MTPLHEYGDSSGGSSRSGSQPKVERSVHRLSVATLVAAVTLVALGGFTRGSGSGYGCADRWPLCEGGLLGGWLPRAEYHMVVEWSHRWLAAWVGILAVLTAVQAWRRLRLDRLPAASSTAAVVAIGVQAWVGREVVKGYLSADLVSVHLGISMVVVALLAITAVSTRRLDPAPRDVSWIWCLAGGAAGSLAVLLLGSLVHNQYVPGWPLVSGNLIPELSTAVVLVHFLHRAAAGLVAAYLIYLVISVRRRRRPRLERITVDMAAVLHFVNVGLGGLHVLTRVQSSGIVVAHLAAAAMVWALLVGAATAAARQTGIDAGPAANGEMIAPQVGSDTLES